MKGFANRFQPHKSNKKSSQKNEFFGKLQRAQQQQKFQRPKGQRGRSGG